jgi:membrane protein
VRPLGAGVRTALELLRWPVLILVLVYGFSLLYRVGAKRPVAWRFGVARGAIAAGIAFIPVSLGLGFYTSRIASLNETYGSLAGLIVMMLWLYVGAWIIVLGAELDAALSEDPPDDIVVASVEGP